MKFRLRLNKFCKIVLALGLISGLKVFAHQSEDFIKILGSSLEAKNSWNFSSSTEWSQEFEDRYIVKPSISYGINDYLSADIHSHFDGTHPSDIEFKGCALQLKTVSNKEYLNLTWGAAFEIAQFKFKQSPTQKILFNKPRFHAYHQISSDLQKSKNEILYELVLINAKKWRYFELNTQFSNQWLNSDHYQEFGLGVRSLTPIILSLELLGAFHSSSQFEIWTSISKELSHHISLQLGAGHGLSAHNQKRGLAFSINIYP